MKLINIFLVSSKKKLSYDYNGYWTCARCGTTNHNSRLYFSKCQNRRPFD